MHSAATAHNEWGGSEGLWDETAKSFLSARAEMAAVYHIKIRLTSGGGKLCFSTWWTAVIARLPFQNTSGFLRKCPRSKLCFGTKCRQAPTLKQKTQQCCMPWIHRATRLRGNAMLESSSPNEILPMWSPSARMDDVMVIITQIPWEGQKSRKHPLSYRKEKRTDNLLLLEITLIISVENGISPV